MIDGLGSVSSLTNRRTSNTSSGSNTSGSSSTSNPNNLNAVVQQEVNQAQQNQSSGDSQDDDQDQQEQDNATSNLVNSGYLLTEDLAQIQQDQDQGQQTNQGSGQDQGGSDQDDEDKDNQDTGQTTTNLDTVISMLDQQAQDSIEQENDTETAAEITAKIQQDFDDKKAEEEEANETEGETKLDELTISGYLLEDDIAQAKKEQEEAEQEVNQPMPKTIKKTIEDPKPEIIEVGNQPASPDWTTSGELAMIGALQEDEEEACRPFGSLALCLIKATEEVERSLWEQFTYNLENKPLVGDTYLTDNLTTEAGRAYSEGLLTGAPIGAGIGLGLVGGAAGAAYLPELALSAYSNATAFATTTLASTPGLGTALSATGQLAGLTGLFLTSNMAGRCEQGDQSACDAALGVAAGYQQQVWNQADAAMGEAVSDYVDDAFRFADDFGLGSGPQTELGFADGIPRELLDDETLRLIGIRDHYTRAAELIAGGESKAAIRLLEDEVVSEGLGVPVDLKRAWTTIIDPEDLNNPQLITELLQINHYDPIEETIIPASVGINDGGKVPDWVKQTEAVQLLKAWVTAGEYQGAIALGEEVGVSVIQKLPAYPNPVYYGPSEKDLGKMVVDLFKFVVER